MDCEFRVALAVRIQGATGCRSLPHGSTKLETMSRKRWHAEASMPNLLLMLSSKMATSGSLMNWEQWPIIACTPSRDGSKPNLGRMSFCTSKASFARPGKW
mmetsp:Transcript_46685/g.101718  ORF Transcript_46685/g.101718 Transcript_46685/m.101718 type:complete len:101 (+) Transcript_46685:82-384(+)